LATSRCNGIWEITRVTGHNRHNGLLPAPNCYGRVTDLLQEIHWETGVMDFGLKPVLDYCNAML